MDKRRAKEDNQYEYKHAQNDYLTKICLKKNSSLIITNDVYTAQSIYLLISGISQNFDIFQTQFFGFLVIN